jgi:subfamily B ATP-binding cassette protein MsbA
MAAAVRVFDVLDIKPDIFDKQDAIVLPQFQRSIEFRDVVFQYEEKPVLKGLNFSAPAGQVVAFVGHSGAGKTTIANLLLRFYDVKAGSIMIDGTDIRDVTIRSLREQIAFVAQETVLFNDTVSNNISYGSPEVTQAQIIEAATAALAHDFIEAMPEGYNTVIGEKGVRLSGGQRQRLAIARALVKNAPILILDEATSALDTHSEQLVQAALENLMKGRTTIMIAHRLSTVRNADQIIVLQEGDISELGSHQDLLDQKGIYNRLIEIQSGYEKKTRDIEELLPEPVPAVEEEENSSEH